MLAVYIVTEASVLNQIFWLVKQLLLPCLNLVTQNCSHVYMLLMAGKF